LARLAEQEAQDQHIQCSRREKERADAAWMKKVNSVHLLLLKVHSSFTAVILYQLLDLGLQILTINFVVNY